MRKQISFLLILFFTRVLFSQNPNIQLVDAFPNLTFAKPVHLTYSPDGTNRIFIVEQNGIIKVIPNDSNVNNSQVNIFLNISNKISSSNGEEGLLGLAFHPNYINNGYFYVNYTAPNPLRTVISRFKVLNGNPNKADSLSETIILTFQQPFANHNGGTLMFGLDGYLYIATGDGGSGGDPFNNAQNTQTLLGKILRIDINDSTQTKKYVIPPTNPFYNNPSAGIGEIFAYGLRNPWKISQDLVTGIIYAGDVGQSGFEEIDIIESGKNYGWRVLEGFSCYNPPVGCDTTGKTMPIKVYSHLLGDCSITGGYVYRGTRRPELQGAYIYGDYCTGRIWMLRYQNGIVTSDSLLIDSPYMISSFGLDQNNEFYILHHSTNGKIYKFNVSASVGIMNQNSILPDNYYLKQNYPNPFNPTTKIEFGIPELTYVKLNIYNSIGQEVKSLVNSSLPSGNYSVLFDGKDNYGNNLPSGVYFYSLITNSYSESKRMVLVK
ncbi:MAG: PQQ-dependent sugar dehydrogenase [Ignavibacteria bacterium]|nr:PQQ-dependent sugar dehydrogenase [Ignavibacteria bacterium]